MIVSNLKCDVCGFTAAIKPNLSGWYVGNTMKSADENIIQVGPLPIKELESDTTGAKHICGLECVHKFVDSIFNAPRHTVEVRPLDLVDGVA